MMILCLVWLFIMGCTVGSLLNVCIHRLPLEKSIIWPSSRCSSCLQPIRAYDNIPLVSYLVLRGRCRTCGARFSCRYFLLELFTGCCFAGLFYQEVCLNIHDLAPLRMERELMVDRHQFPTWPAWVVWGSHALLISFLIVTTFCDFDRREIPLSVTVTGTIIGLLISTLFPWPWPNPNVGAAPLVPGGLENWMNPDIPPKMGLYPWPFWGPLPAWFGPGTWQTGLATGLVGALVGTLMLRVIRFLFGLGLGVEALGLGDADLMMMAGSFLGWQPIVAGFFIGVFAGLILGVVQLVARGDNTLPFGPALAVGVVVSMLCWRWIGPQFQTFFFNGLLLAILVVVAGVLMVVLSYALRVLRLLRH